MTTAPASQPPETAARRRQSGPPLLAPSWHSPC